MTGDILIFAQMERTGEALESLSYFKDFAPLKQFAPKPAQDLKSF